MRFIVKPRNGVRELKEKVKRMTKYDEMETNSKIRDSVDNTL